MVNTEKQIKETFNKLQQFLFEEEQARSAALRREGKEKSKKMKETIKRINTNIALLSDTVEDIKQELRAEDVSFLQVRMFRGNQGAK